MLIDSRVLVYDGSVVSAASPSLLDREFEVDFTELAAGKPDKDRGAFFASCVDFDPFNERAVETVLGAQVAARHLLTSMAEAGGVRRWYMLAQSTETHPADRAEPGLLTDHLVSGPMFWRSLLAEADALLRNDFIHALVALGPVSMEHVIARARTQAFTVPSVSFTHSILDAATIWLGLATAPSTPADLIITPSVAGKRATQAHLQRVDDACGRQVFAGEVAVLPYGVVASPKLPPRAEARQKLGWRDDEIVFLSLSRLDRDFKYDPTPLILIFAELHKRLGKKVRLVLAGSASDQDVERLVQVVAGVGLNDHIELRPNFPFALKPSLHAGADVFVAFSDNYQETHGLAVLDAMAAGLPVIAADWSGYRETVMDGVTGMLVPTFVRHPDPSLQLIAAAQPGRACPSFQPEQVVIDLPRTLSAMISFATDAHKRAQLGAAGAQRVRDHFDEHKTARRTMERIGQSIATARAFEGKRYDLGADWEQTYLGFASSEVTSKVIIKRGPWSFDELPTVAHHELGLAGRKQIAAMLAQAYSSLDQPMAMGDLVTKLHPSFATLNAAAIERWIVRAAKYGVFSF